MALTRYRARPVPTNELRQFATQEFRSIQLTTDQIIELLAAVGVPVQVGPADSAGVGFRALRIPN